VNPAPPKPPRLLNVAAYARVSADKDSMLHSLSAQICFYSDLIQKNPSWRYAGVYADKALTGTKAERPEFQRLLADCRAGEIDMVITKSISRFARNTVTLLETVRELKTLGVDVYFEEQNIHSMSGDGELMLTILASYAQEESRSVSENCKWRIHKSYKAGKPVTWRFLYGYRIRKGEVEIHPLEVEIVREVFDSYLRGVATADIATSLREREIPCYRGGTWTPNRVVKLLKNEKYAGNALLQKQFKVDHLSKKEQRNIGQLPIYFAEGTHPAIITPETYQQARELMERNRLLNGIKCKAPESGVFTGMITCASCGQNYKRKRTHGKTAWNCTTYLMMGKKHCHAKQIPEDILIATTASALGLREFDEKVFKSMVRKIHVPAFNHLVYEFMDGTQIERVWQDKLRDIAWTEEMRRQAAEKARKRWEK
jgi:DNA invertase Pin-like site-specific DNA recombinase